MTQKEQDKLGKTPKEKSSKLCPIIQKIDEKKTAEHNAFLEALGLKTI